MAYLIWAFHHLDQIESLERMRLLEALHCKHPADTHRKLRAAATFHQEEGEKMPLDPKAEDAELDKVAALFGLTDRRKRGGKRPAPAPN